MQAVDEAHVHIHNHKHQILKNSEGTKGCTVATTSYTRHSRLLLLLFCALFLVDLWAGSAGTDPASLSRIRGYISEHPPSIITFAPDRRNFPEEHDLSTRIHSLLKFELFFVVYRHPLLRIARRPRPRSCPH